MNIVLLHHSTGGCIWKGGVAGWFEAYNARQGTAYRISEQAFPKDKPYGWSNYPFDYYNLWVEHAGAAPFMDEPTLELLTKTYQVIVFKHCFPVSNIKEDIGQPDIRSKERRLENYRLQYGALKEKLRSFPNHKFIVWTGAALTAQGTTPEQAQRARAFFEWVRSAWDEPGDNIFLWDLHALQTEGGLYFKDEYAAAPGDSHPSAEFSRRAAPLLCRRIVDVIEGRGDRTPITGKPE
ncbi:MAG: hypothetical protein HY291_05780 [Planctomycetes bacterium]|nr:hypothetical protein [Planctomycetota bacterium]